MAFWEVRREENAMKSQDGKQKETIQYPGTLWMLCFSNLSCFFFYEISHSKSAEKEREETAGPFSHYCCAGSRRNTFESDVIVNLKHSRQRLGDCEKPA